MAALHPLVAFYAGDTWQISGALTSGDGSTINLAGAAIEWKLEDDSGAVLLDLSLGSGIAVMDASAGVILITVSKDQSKVIAPGRYSDQLRLVAGDGTVSTQWVGFIDVKPSFFPS